MNKKRWISAMLIMTLTCGLSLTACGGTQGSSAAMRRNAPMLASAD